MNPSIVQKQIRQNHIRQGLVYKRSKFLKQWQQRWIILTKNYIYLYQDKSKKSMTDSIDLKQIKNYKSYVRKEQDVITSCLKIRSDDNMYYLSFTSISEKWSWMVTIERLMDFKISGNSIYNSEEWIKVKGFSSQVEFGNKKHLESMSMSTDTNDYKKERDQLKKKLVEQEKFYQRQLKEKYEKLNTIEVSMLEKKKSYQELIGKHESSDKSLEKNTSNTQISQSSTTNNVQQSKPVEGIFKNLFASAPVQKVEDKQQIPLQLMLKKQQTQIKSSQVQKNIPKQQNLSTKLNILRQPENTKNIQIHQSHKLNLFQSLIGYTPHNQQQKSLYIHNDLITQRKIAPNDIPKQVKKPINLAISQVQTMLGYSIPSGQQERIHTKGHTANLVEKEAVKIEERQIGQSLQIQKVKKQPMVFLEQQVAIPSEPAKIRQENKINLLESILGYSITKKEEGDLFLNAQIIPHVLPKVEVIPQKKEVFIQKYQNIEKIYEVQTMLGYSLSPSSYRSIYTDGHSYNKTDNRQQIIKQNSKEQKIQTKLSSNNDRQVVANIQKPKANESPKKQLSSQQKPALRTEVVIEQQSIKPSLIKQASTKNDEVPVWAKNQQISQNQKLQSQPQMIRRVSTGLVSNMKNLFQSKTIEAKQAQRRQSNLYQFKKQ